MRKGVNLVRKLFVLMLTVMLALSMAAIPSFADDITITIKNNEGLPAMKDGQYQTFQIFSGRPGAMGPGDQSQELIDIEWGDGVNPVKVVEALKKSELTEFASLKDLTEISTNAEKEASAREVAAILAANTENSFLQDFAGVIANPANDCVIEEKVRTSTAVNSPASPVNDYSKIQVPTTGYYLIEQVTKTGVDFVTSFILRVIAAEGTTVNLKADIPELHKEIVDGDSTTTDVAGIGDTVTFKIWGDLPSNYGEYEYYYYTFTDRLSKGLTYQGGSLKVVVGDYELTSGEAAQVVSRRPDGDVDVITISLGDLKRKDAPWETKGNLDAGSHIYFEYSAIVNENAVIGGTGNPNTAELEYSNDPNNNESKGKTPPSEVHVFTFSLEINKVDKDHHETKLPGAVFVISKKDAAGTVTYYSTKDDTDNPGNKIVEWCSAPSDGDLEKLPESARLKTDVDGKLTVKGLDNGTYTVTEIEAPSGYNKIPAFDVTVNGTVSDDGVTDLAVSFPVGGGDVTAHTADKTTGVISLTVVDPKAPFLPFTGGAGTVIFYVVGAALVIGAVVLLVIANRKKQ